MPFLQKPNKDGGWSILSTVILPLLLVLSIGAASVAIFLTSQQEVPIKRSYHRGLQEDDDFKTSAMLEKFQVARAKFMEKLAKDYGSENVALLFKGDIDGSTVSISRLLFGKSQVSWDRVKRKMQIKILKAQIEQTPQKFVWATGGHSAAAGHGNLFNESYTVVMGQRAQNALAAVGLDLEARPYAMGGMSQGMEISWCLKEIYGLDVDILSSDFSMTTVNRPDKSSMWHFRSGLLPSRPALVEFYFRVPSVVEDMEEKGFADIMLDNNVLDTILNDKIPDTSGKSQDEIDAMPKFVRSFRCDKTLEKGEPTCDQDRYTMLPDDDPCNKRKGRVSWHPGWKWHALIGNYLTLFLLDIADDALNGISVGGSDPKAMLDKLKAGEDEELKDWSKALPRSLNKEVVEHADIPEDVIYKNPNICHTALLPSESRYKGILTESETKGGIDYGSVSADSYDHGLEINEARHKADEGMLMPISWNPDDRQTFCKNDRLIIDFHDFFVVNSDTTAKLVLPNPTEKTYYKLDQPFHGIIAMCEAGCGWGCPKGVVTHEGYLSGNITMAVNGVAVTNFTAVEGDNCNFLKHAGGHKFDANAQGLFEITAKVNAENLYSRISAFILW